MKGIATYALIFLILIVAFITFSIPSLIEEIEINRTTTTTYTQITDPLILGNVIVLESKELILKYGFSENYFNQHFKLLSFEDDVINLPYGGSVIWEFEIGEYKVRIYDSLGYYIGREGTRIIHSIAPALTQQLPTVHDIENVIPKSEAERLMRSCIGEFKDAEAVLDLNGLLGDPVLVYRASPIKDSLVCPSPGLKIPCYIKYGVIDLESGKILGCVK